MPFEVKLPDIGEGVAEGEIVRWLVKPGDAVKEDQPLVEVMTDKANVEIPSPRAGTIDALLAEEGQVVPVGTVIVTIAVAADSAARAVGGGAGASPSVPKVDTGPLRPASPPTGSVDSPSSPTASATTVQATPAVRQLARQLGVALETVRPTGPGGRVTAEDVQRAATPGGSVATGSSQSPRMAAGGEPKAGRSDEERVPLRGLRRRIAEAMRRSLDTAAHFTFVVECDMSAVAAHLARTRPRAEQSGVPLTYLAYVVKALAEPLRQFPLLNASLDDEAHEIVLKRYYHVGIATATAEGLTVPVVRDVDTRPLLGIAAEIKRLATAARGGGLKLEELQGGTFTVTSTGARGGLLATPIVHHPQVAILGVHEVKKRPVVVDDQIVAREMTNLSLSLDHRVVDGAVGADFLYTLVARLGDPAAWLDERAIG
jgi:pyruvate dehydrogenase E2 component (dihydrolipoamide acetyltransferase)